MKVLFVDHEFHRKTRSSNFFTDILHAYFDVEVLYLDPDSLASFEKLQAVERCDVAILWQLDFLAPIFLAQEIPTIVIPMYDGSANMPDLHWLWARQGHFINFSRRLHSRITGLGCRSFLARYFPEPPAQCETTPERYDELHAFFWQRRPDAGLHVGAVNKLLGNQLASLHVHDVPDDKAMDTSAYLAQAADSYTSTVSKWLPDAGAYGELLRKANVFVAPRHAEGIGLAFLEAMAHGMIVIAADRPTHDEYLANWITGILFNPDNPGLVDLHDKVVRHRIGSQARQASVRGHQEWRRQQSQIVDVIRSARTPPKPVRAIDIPGTARALAGAYYAGGSRYLAYLAQNISLIEEMSGLSLRGRLAPNFDYRPRRVNERGTFDDRLRSAAEQMPWLRGQEIKGRAAEERGLVVAGKLVHDGDVSWLAGQRAVFGFRLDPRDIGLRALRVDLRAPDAAQKTGYCFALNGWTIGLGSFEGGGATLELEVPAHALQIENELLIQTDALAFSGAEQPTSLGFTSLVFC